MSLTNSDIPIKCVIHLMKGIVLLYILMCVILEIDMKL